MEKKLRHSHQREMIYEYLYASKEHPSAEMIYEDLKKIEPTLSLGTVYRNLKLLEELGKIKKVTSVNNIERYDCCCEDHVHFICDKCGRVLDLPDFNKEIIINCNFTSGEVEVTGVQKAAYNLQNSHGTLKTLLESVDYRLPIDVHKDNWTTDYHFVITSVRNGYAHGDIYIGNRYQKQSSYPIDRPYHIYTFYQS